MSGTFIEIGVPSAKAARVFYAGLLGWSFRDQDNGCAAETPAFEIGVHPDDEDRNMVVYFAVPDIEVAVRRVRELGGTAPEPGPEVEGFGRFVECKDDQGVRFGLRQAPGKR